MAEHDTRASKFAAGLAALAALVAPACNSTGFSSLTPPGSSVRYGGQSQVEFPNYGGLEFSARRSISSGPPLLSVASEKYGIKSIEALTSAGEIVASQTTNAERSRFIAISLDTPGVQKATQIAIAFSDGEMIKINLADFSGQTLLGTTASNKPLSVTLEGSPNLLNLAEGIIGASKTR